MNARVWLFALALLCWHQVSIAQAASQPTLGTLEDVHVSSDALRDIADRAKQATLVELRKIGGNAAIRAKKLQGLQPRQFFERLSLNPIVGPSAIAPPKVGVPTPFPAVNDPSDGGATTGHPGVAFLLARRSGVADFGPMCTGTLVRQNVVLTAAHCVCWSKNYDLNYVTGKECVHGNGSREGSSLTASTSWRVFFQHVGMRQVKQVIVNEDYHFDDHSVGSDLALLVLSTPVSEIDPPPLPSEANPAATWQSGQIIGYGFSAMQRGATVLWQLTSPGLKANGGVHSSRCDGLTFLDQNGSLCSLFDPDGGGSPTTVCGGDSGGPLRKTDGTDTTIGVTSGRDSENCAATGTVGFQMATSFQPYRRWIETQLNAVAVASLPGVWPTFGENLHDIVGRFNAGQFDEKGAFLAEGWLDGSSLPILATINSSGRLTKFEVQDRSGKVLCSGQAGSKNHIPNVDYCSTTVPMGTQFRIVAAGERDQFLQYVVTTHKGKQ